MEKIALLPIGIVENAILAPRDDHWGAVESLLRFDPEQFTEESFLGIEGFSHLEIIYLMHLVDDAAVPTGARRPRNRPHLPLTGIFAQRPKARPNRLGLSVCEFIAREGMVIRVRGLDAINETPILDIKPYFSQFAPRGPVRHPPWVDEITHAYW